MAASALRPFWTMRISTGRPPLDSCPSPTTQPAPPPLTVTHHILCPCTPTCQAPGPLPLTLLLLFLDHLILLPLGPFGPSIPPIFPSVSLHTWAPYPSDLLSTQSLCPPTLSSIPVLTLVPPPHSFCSSGTLPPVPLAG